jgi:hypothetical protein
MKQIRKLSSKLLLALGVTVLSAIVWQVIVSKRVIGDMGKIRQVQSIEQIQNLLKKQEIKNISFHSLPPFFKNKTKRNLCTGIKRKRICSICERLLQTTA